jgi:hypothetical protein
MADGEEERHHRRLGRDAVVVVDIGEESRMRLRREAAEVAETWAGTGRETGTLTVIHAFLRRGDTIHPLLEEGEAGELAVAVTDVHHLVQEVRLGGAVMIDTTF